MTTHVLSYLFDKDYHYRIQCFLGDTVLKMLNPWWDDMESRIKKARNGEEVRTDLYEIWKDYKWSCDICRVEISWYEYAFGCYEGDWFCMTCIHTIVMQYNQLKPFLMKILEKELIQSCIVEIVEFCVAKVDRFDADSDNSRKKEDCKSIEDGKSVGSKRCMKVDTNASCKRQRLK